MKRFYPLFFVVLIGAVLFTAVIELPKNSPTTQASDWRDDYRNLKEVQFIKKHGRTFLNAVQKCCDSNLVCGWETSGGEL